MITVGPASAVRRSKNFNVAILSDTDFDKCRTWHDGTAIKLYLFIPLSVTTDHISRSQKCKKKLEKPTTLCSLPIKLKLHIIVKCVK